MGERVTKSLKSFSLSASDCVIPLKKRGGGGEGGPICLGLYKMYMEILEKYKYMTSKRNAAVLYSSKFF